MYIPLAIRPAAIDNRYSNISMQLKSISTNLDLLFITTSGHQ